MKLDGHLAEPELSGDLLVHFAHCHLGHDLALALAQRFDAGLQLSNNLFLFLSVPMIIERNLQGIQQVLVANRFRQELDCASLHRFDGHRDVAMCSDKKRWEC